MGMGYSLRVDMLNLYLFVDLGWDIMGRDEGNVGMI